MVDFTVPIYTAIAQLTSFTLGYKPQLVVSNVGIDPTTVGGLLKTVSKGKASGTGLIEGAITDGYLPSPSDTSNPWIQLFKKIHDQYDAERAVRRQRRVRDGQRLHARPGAPGGGQEPDPPGPGQRDQRRRRQVDGRRDWSRSATRRATTAASAAPRSARSAAARSSCSAGR